MGKRYGKRLDSKLSLHSSEMQPRQKHFHHLPSYQGLNQGSVSNKKKLEWDIYSPML